jgi:hypothetical protein
VGASAGVCNFRQAQRSYAWIVRFFDILREERCTSRHLVQIASSLHCVQLLLNVRRSQPGCDLHWFAGAARGT